MPETVATHPCVFATLTAPSFGPVHTPAPTRAAEVPPLPTPRDKHTDLPTRPGSSCPQRHGENDSSGQPLCPDCYDYDTGSSCNACAPELWRRSPSIARELDRLAGVPKRCARRCDVRFVKVAEYQAAGVIHFHAIFRLDAPGRLHPPPPALPPLLTRPRHRRATRRHQPRRPASHDLVTRHAALLHRQPSRRGLHLGTEVDTRRRQRRPAGWQITLGTAVAKYIAKYATKSIERLAALTVLSAARHYAQRCQPYKRLSSRWHLGKHSYAALRPEPLDPHAGLSRPLPH